MNETLAPPPPAPAVESTDSNNLDLGGPPRFSWTSLLWPIGLSLGVLALILWFTFEPGMFGRMLDAVNPWIMSGAVLMLVIRVLFGGWRLHWVSGGRISPRSGIRGQLAWDFASNLSPSLVGGAPLAAVYIARDTRVSGDERVDVGEVGAFMLFTMLLDNCWFALSAPLVLAATAFMEVIPDALGTVGMVTTVAYLAIFMIWTALFGYGVLFRPDLLRTILTRLVRLPGLRRFKNRVEQEMDGYQRRAAVIRAQPLRFFVIGFLLTAGTWIGRYLLAVFVIWAVVPELDLILATIRSIAMTLGSLVMPTPGGAGGVEGLFAVFMGPLMPSAFVVPTLLVWRLLAYYIFVVIGVVVSTRHVQKSTRYNREHANGA